MKPKSVYLVAEPGGQHGGDLGRMLECIQVAAKAGADAIKLQWTSDPHEMAERRGALDYERHYRNLAFPAIWHPVLAEQARAAGLDYACTVYINQDIRVVAPHVSWFKVASYEAQALGFLAAHLPYLYEPFSSRHKFLVVSTGLSDEDDLLRLARWRREYLSDTRQLIRFLHCVAGYPAQPEEMGLRLLKAAAAFGEPIFDGLSDHTGHPLMGALATMAGARWLEVHFQTAFRPEDEPERHPDAGLHAHPPLGLKEYVARVRWAEAILGPGGRHRQPSEDPWLRFRVRASDA